MAYRPWVFIRTIWVRDVINTKVLRGATGFVKSFLIDACLIPAEFRITARLPGVDNRFSSIWNGGFVENFNSIREKYRAEEKRMVSYIIYEISAGVYVL